MFLRSKSDNNNCARDDVHERSAVLAQDLCKLSSDVSIFSIDKLHVTHQAQKINLSFLQLENPS